jgi:hypothetical protein
MCIHGFFFSAELAVYKRLQGLNSFENLLREGEGLKSSTEFVWSTPMRLAPPPPRAGWAQARRAGKPQCD